MTGAWSNVYIGLRYADLGRDRFGVDCWGLVRLAFHDQLGIELPSYDGTYVSAQEHGEVSALIEGARHTGDWMPVSTPHQAFDLLVFRAGRFDAHLGLVAEPGAMLHVVINDQAKIERYSDPSWNHRLTGVYRHRLVPTGGAE
ncbi:NlpC/P60 family protein [Rhizobium sp. PP-CC-2G-626]|nr:NlpC/P60 family protein [Rhizobium sp. PP-CC-2G-626]